MIALDLTLSTVTIIVLNWNGGDDTLQCMESLQALRYTKVKFVLVDNGSTDGSVQRVREAKLARPPFIIETHANLGFAEGNNVGIRHALANGADFVLLLNNDTVVAPDLLDELVAAAQASPRAAVLSCKIFYFDDPQRIWYAGARWLAQRRHFEHVGIGQLDGPAFDVPSETGYASGCAFFMRADALRDIGLLDARYFLTYEESDLCYRARDAGWSVLYAPRGRLWHKVSASFGGAESPLQLYFYSRNSLLWAERHLPRRDWLALLAHVLRDALRVDLGPSGAASRPRRAIWAWGAAWRRVRRGGTDPHARARWLGLCDYLTRRFGNCPDEVRQLNRATRLAALR